MTEYVIEMWGNDKLISQFYLETDEVLGYIADTVITLEVRDRTSDWDFSVLEFECEVVVREDDGTPQGKVIFDSTDEEWDAFK